jgi:hypothetical protein
VLGRSPGVGHGHAADHFVASGAQRGDATAECGTGGYDVIDQHDSAPTGSIPRRERLRNVLAAAASVAFGLLLGVPHAT